jgi:hypothetical protein
MAKLIDVVNDFNHNRNVISYLNVIKKWHEDYKLCVKCDGPIIYYDSYLKPRSKSVGGKSFKSFKRIKNKTYNLQVCEKCLTDKYPDYREKNKSRVFNQMNKYSKYAYGISEEDYNYQKNLYVLTTEDNLIRKYGLEKGKEKWEDYKKKQAYSNSYDYKKNKYNWSKKEYDKYNSDRAVTLENLIKRHGKTKGKEKWEKYIERQSITKSKDYYINKYGEKEWVKLCNSKAHTFENYIKWYGSEKMAFEKIKERHNMWNSVSKSSQRYLEAFDKYLKNLYPNLETYYHSLNKEYMIITKLNKIYYLDYYIKDWNIAIEYNGDLFHANPKKFKSNDKPIPGSNLTSEKIWAKDYEKNKTIKEERNTNIVIVWESNLPSEKKLLEIINGKRL